MRWRYPVIIGGLAAVLGAGGWFVLAGSGTSGTAAADQAADVRQGGRLYQQYCATCHGMNRQGQANWRERKADGRLPAPPLDGSGHTWHHPDSQLVAIITHGVEAFAPDGYESDMKGFADKLDEAEIRAILAYLKAKWPAAKRERQADITAKSGE